MSMTKSEAGKLGFKASQQKLKENKQYRIDTYNINPKKCLNCGSVLSYQKRKNEFCNNSCSASYNNKGVRRHGKGSKLNKCLNCGSNTYNKYCKQRCQHEFKWKMMKLKFEKTGVFGNDQQTRTLGKRYLIEKHGHKCQICKTANWLGKPILLIADHIDGVSTNNTINNIRIICSNCDATLPTYKAKNKSTRNR